MCIFLKLTHSEGGMWGMSEKLMILVDYLSFEATWNAPLYLRLSPRKKKCAKSDLKSCKASNDEPYSQ
ncbi:hypothetical protein LYNGBM3L_17070 [Moorena producens 3L]|uniref:Uncharacterized protein n=1 Tax=Moorena producens 3L TaxID=489825 RepID=F4XSD4_9CYAN|nr:hypothetical protein LYNGBM3L_17070 [Moorena producens 3L]OLT67109.1 hypothetical protein BI334_20690 [Moorena producens 3L]